MIARYVGLTWLVGFLGAAAALAGGPHEDPSADGSTGLFTVPRASTLDSGRLSIGSYYETLCREEGSSNVERGGIYAAVGLGGRFELFASADIRTGVRRDFVVEDARGFPQSSAPRLNDHPLAGEHWQHGFGDVRIGGKFKLLGPARSYSGLSVQSYVKLPTAKDSEGIGTGKTDFVGDLIASLEAGGAVGLNGRLGINLKGDPDGIELSNELLWGLGLHLPTRFWLQGIVELYGVHYLSDEDRFRSPVGLRNYAILQGGLRLSLGMGLAISGGLNRNLSIDDGPGIEPEKLGSFVQISYSTRPRPPLPPPPPPIANRAPSITCRAETTSVRRGESVRVLAEARDADGDVVSISWAASDGSVSPSTGSTATWSSAGVTGSSVTLTATASDGKGESVTCEVRVRIDAPPPPPAPTSRRLLCSDFPARSARLDNRCKAVLDDVAVQLRTNPRATARLVAHSDAGDGTRASSVANQRAQNAFDYLVQTHGVTASRITTESQAGTSRQIEIEISVP